MPANTIRTQCPLTGKYAPPDTAFAVAFAFPYSLLSTLYSLSYPC
jgi:hypothetical protein